MPPYFQECDKKSVEKLYGKTFNLAKIIVLYSYGKKMLDKSIQKKFS